MKAAGPNPVSIDALENGTIDADRFDHEAHIYAGWLYLNAFGFAVAADRFAAALKRLTEKLGVPGKYHDTITRFYLSLIAERRSGKAAGDWRTFKAGNADLFVRSSDILARYYSRERLMSDAARRRYLPPDLLPDERPIRKAR